MELEILNRMSVRKFFFAKLVLPLSGLLLFASCEQTAKVDLPEVPSKLVINCFLTPQDTQIRVRVTKSNPIFHGSNVDVDEPVANATVYITGSSGAVQLTFDNVLGFYTVPAAMFPILEGNTYAIEVSAPQMETVTATTSVPGAAPADFAASMNYTIDSSGNPMWSYSGDINTSFTDFAADGDYYRVSSHFLEYSPFQADTISWLFGSDFIRDQDGQAVSLTNHFEFEMTNPNAGSGDIPVAMNIALAHCSKEYYEFHQSLYSHSNGDDPFSEPTLMYTNVQHGYGIFAGASYRVFRVNF